MTGAAADIHPDNAHMARALELAARGLYSTQPNPRVGCVLVKGGSLIAEGWHTCAGEPHAEIIALDKAGDQARGATTFVNLEPCCHHGRTPPCTEALIQAGIKKVVVAMQDPNPLVSGKGIERLQAAGIKVELGVLERQARDLNVGFIKRMTLGTPYVRLKMAMSLDGRTAMASGESQWITEPPARSDVQRLRARSCAILTGIGTLLLDDPSLTVRENELGLVGPVRSLGRQPHRVIIDSQFRTPLNAKALSASGEMWVIGAAENTAATRLSNAGVHTQVLADQQSDHARVDLPAVLKHLGEQGCNELLVEAGAKLSGAFLSADLVDELVIYLAPTLLGHNARPLFQLNGLERMSDKLNLEIKQMRKIGTDIRINAIVSRQSGLGE